MTEYLDAILAGAYTGRYGRARLNCPLCTQNGKVTPDDSRSLAYNAKTRKYRCYRCGAWGYAGDGVPYVDVDHGESPRVFMPRHTSILSPTAAHQRAYMNSRGIQDVVLEDAGVVVATEGMLRTRVVVPIRRVDESLAGWVARIVPPDKNPLKYMYARGTERVVYNGAILTTVGPPVYVVEGVFDALPHWPLVVACLGKPTNAQLLEFKRSRRPLVFALDGDSWEEAQWWALRMTLEGVSATWLRLPPGTDPGDHSTRTMSKMKRRS